MKTIEQYAHAGNLITVTETHDANYAHDCFDGSDREWSELIIDNPLVFYIVSCGLAGCYMADEVSVFTSKRDALTSAKDTLELWQEQDDETEVE